MRPGGTRPTSLPNGQELRAVSPDGARLLRLGLRPGPNGVVTLAGHRCGKCGSNFGFANANPEFWTGQDDAGHLRWRCSTCGYVIDTPTADAP